MFDVGRTLLAAAARDEDALAIVDGARRMTYGALRDEACRVAQGLDDLGLSKGDRLLIIMQNRWEMVVTYFAAQLVGVVATPINWRAEACEVEYFLKDSGAKAVLYEPVAEAAVAACTEAGDLPRIGVNGADGRSHTFEDLLACQAATEVPRAGPHDSSLMLYTSGTTGRGKGVPRSHRAERVAALAHVAQNTYRTGEITLGVMPLYHTMGVRSLLAMVLINGVFVCLPRFSPGAALDLIEAEGVSNLYLVPTLYHDVLGHPDFANRNTSSVRKLGFAGAPMTDGLLKRLDEAFQPDLFVNHYGSSEIYTFTIDQNACAKPGSAGKAGINTEIRVVEIGSTDPEQRCVAGEEGQVIATLAGDEAFEGYWQRADADAKALHAGWYFTGDIGYFDKDGDLFVTGRVDDMIITGGENVLPVEIESCLSLHPAVSEVAVVGMPHERWGQLVTAFLVRGGDVDAGDLDDWCKQSRLANFKRPREYVFVEAIPKSPVGKILRRMLVAGDYAPEAPKT
ncbi:MAG: AMP-binding protein [Rhizobiales bacterium]|nr:AMP-binding protein [Hyphomicrobiales bacterium]